MNGSTQHPMRRRLARRTSAIALIVVAGCGGPANKYDAEVTGTVTIAGELAPSGTITFHPVDNTGKIAVGRIYPDGSFSLRTGQGDLRESDGGTVVPGEYIVTIVVSGPPPSPTTPGGGPPLAGALLIHERYINRDTSDLRQTIGAGDNVLAFDLEPAAPADAEGEAGETGETTAAAPGTEAPTAEQPAEEETGDAPAATPGDAPAAEMPAGSAQPESEGVQP